MASTNPQSSFRARPAPSMSSRSRDETMDTVATVGSAMTAVKRGNLLGKIALARAAIRLARRYPVPALIVAAAAIAIYVASGRLRDRRMAGVRE
jgi:hypothetical protein